MLSTVLIKFLCCSELKFFICLIISCVAKNTSDIFQMSSQKIKENSKNIQFLMGQLKTIHIPDVKTISLQEGFFKYDNYVWTKDFDELFKLYSLGLVAGCIRGFGKTKNDVISSLLYSDYCKPTLSPKDPNFPAWWETHRAEWEEPEKEGKEPADD